MTYLKITRLVKLPCLITVIRACPSLSNTAVDGAENSIIAFLPWSLMDAKDAEDPIWSSIRRVSNNWNNSKERILLSVICRAIERDQYNLPVFSPARFFLKSRARHLSFWISYTSIIALPTYRRYIAHGVIVKSCISDSVMSTKSI